jgi:hypothetical protein
MSASPSRASESGIVPVTAIAVVAAINSRRLISQLPVGATLLQRLPFVLSLDSQDHSNIEQEGGRKLDHLPKMPPFLRKLLIYLGKQNSNFVFGRNDDQMLECKRDILSREGVHIHYS